ncbi:glycerate kinase family protein [Wukongibacter sp. M2B1]|uniref:glycerate kinase family protein n=1 Tax=Wukongibacter sp. M2B1 TaxID=3088895 RepID=UPI003D7A42EC
MNILVAPDSFKGSLSAKVFCDIAEKAIKSVLPCAKVIKIPLADGGEGTVEALVLNTGGRIINKAVTGPLLEKVDASFGILGDGKTAILEMASASGLPLVPEDKRNPMLTTTFGTGELIREALDRGCKKIILGIGGSATNDGGAGMLQALGFKLLNDKGESIQWGAKGLLELDYIDMDGVDWRIGDIDFLVACDVDNPLYGENGAAFVYGPQKGANEDMVLVLDNALRHFDKVIQRDIKKQVAYVPGSGAAGGLGAGLLAFLDAELKPGFEIIMNTINLEEVFRKNSIDLVITGEGEINYQTVSGKLPVGIAKLAKKYGVPVIAIVGAIGDGAEKVYDKGIDSIMSIINSPMDLEKAMENAPRLLEDTVYRVMKLITLLD